MNDVRSDRSQATGEAALRPASETQDFIKDHEPNTAAAPDPFATVSPSEPPLAGPVVEGLGSTLAGYELLHELGRGGMGVVYRARQVQAKRDVAVKLILSGEHASSDDLKRFRIEAEAVAQLQHPHIVAIYEVGEHGGRPYFSMEYCPGGSLAKKSAGGPLTIADAAGMVRKLAHAVAAAHAAGIVHRDLKPGNVLLTADGEPKVTDFGLAKRLTENPGDGPTSTGAVLGTPSFMAPEQAFGNSKHVGPPADVYALGAILYDLLIGRPPFHGATAMDTLVQVVSEDPVPPRQLRPEIPRDLELICLKCLEKDPTRRYQTASALAGDLTRFLDGEPVSVTPTGIASQLAGAMDRVQLKAQFAGYGGLLLGMAPVMLFVELWIMLVAWCKGPLYLVELAQWGRLALFLALIGYSRGWRWRPNGTAERQLWGIWGGYLFTIFALGVSHRLVSHEELSEKLKIYQPLSCLTAFAFFTLAPNFWGYAAVIGIGFVAASFVMAIDLNWAPLIFGVVWAISLVVIGWRLRQLAVTNTDSQS